MSRTSRKGIHGMTQNSLDYPAFDIGLTGNSGSGKGTVCNILREHGAYCIDCDTLAHGVLAKDGAGYYEALDFFGNAILAEDGTINRRALAAIVFADADKRKILEGIVHKHVICMSFELAKEHAQTSIVVVDAPLLIQAGMHKYCKRVWVVTADTDIRLQRIMLRDTLSYDEALNRLRAQSDEAFLAGHADEVIENNLGISELRERVEWLLHRQESDRCL